MYTNARFQSIRTTSDFGTEFAQNYIDDKTFEKINTKFQSIWITSDFEPKFAPQKYE